MARATTKTAKKTAKRPTKRAAKTAKKAARKPSQRGARKAIETPVRNPTLKATPFRATGKPRGRALQITDPSLNDPDKTVGVAIVDMVADGRPEDLAATIAGVFPETLKDWLSRGAQAWAILQMDEDPDASIPASESPYVALFEELTQATAHSMVAMFDSAYHYGLRDARWQAAFMAMRWPERFGQKRLEITGAGGGPIKTQTEIWSLDKLEAALAVAESHARDRAAALDVSSRPTEIAS